MSSHVQSATLAQLPPQLRWKKMSSAVAPLRADHRLLHAAGRTQTSAGSSDDKAVSPKKTPVAKVPPVKRPLPTYRSCGDSADDADFRAPSAKKPMHSCGPIRIATNPMYRRRSGDTGATPTAVDWRFAVANVAFPAPQPPTPVMEQRSRDVQTSPAEAVTATPVMELPRGRRDVQTSPADPPAAEAVAATPVMEQRSRDVQTSPADHPEPAGTPSMSRLRHTPSGTGDGMSLSSWIRSTRGRMAARLRRSLSAASSPSAAARTPTAAAAADAASTPKRLAGGRNRRFASMQRLVRCLTPKSFADASRCSKASPSPAAAAAARGRVLQLRPDGSRLVRLQRGSGAKFGFVVARERDGGVCLKQFNDAASQLCYNSVIGVGDHILEVEGIPTANFELAELLKFVSDRRTLELLVRSQSCCQW